MAAAPFTFGFQPEIVPSSVAKMKTAGPDLPPSETTNPDEPLNAMPVGVAVSVEPSGGGMVTVSGSLAALPLYTVETPAPLSDIQKGPVGLNAIPHAFLRFGSVVIAVFG